MSPLRLPAWRRPPPWAAREARPETVGGSSLGRRRRSLTRRSHASENDKIVLLLDRLNIER